MYVLDLDALPGLERHAKCLAAFQVMLDLALRASGNEKFTPEERARAERVKAQNYYYRDETLFALAFRPDISGDQRLLAKSLFEAEAQRLNDLLPLKESGQMLSQTVTDAAYEMDLVRERP
jgi:hypothetical protein